MTKKRAEQIDKVRVTIGRLIRVQNLGRPKFSNASMQYYAVQVEGPSGSETSEECLLFTEKEIQAARRRAERNREDLTEKGFFTDLAD